MLSIVLEMGALGTVEITRSSAEDLILQNSMQTEIAASAMEEISTTETGDALKTMGGESRILMRN